MDKALKQRMVGASVIIALIVIVLPMLLSGRPESTSPQSQQIELPPRPESLTFETRRFPVDEAQSPAENSGAPVETAPVVAANRNTNTAVASPSEAERPVESTQNQDSTAMPDTALSAGGEAAKQETAAAAEEEPAPAAAMEHPGTVTSREIASAKPESVDVSAAPPTTGGRFLVQVASLGSAENATRLMTNLQQKGYPVLLDTVESEVGKLNRVRVGPYKTEAEAAAIVGKIDEAFSDLNPKLIDLQPQPTTPVAGSPNSASSDSLARWVVQAGSFSEAVNADRLVAQLRADGMDAYQEKVTSGASPVYRVRIGPFLERESATAAQQALAAKRSINGVVVSAN